MPGSVACVDASVGLGLVLPDSRHEATLAQWRQWIATGTRLVSPHLFAYETTSVIRNRVARGHIPDRLGEAALAEILSLQVELLHPDGLEAAAYGLARELVRPSAYDCFYLALGRLLDCPTWTLDTRLFQETRARVSWLRLITP
jgi:predicted nucleic acid-binding protein